MATTVAPNPRIAPTFQKGMTGRSITVAPIPATMSPQLRAQRQAPAAPAATAPGKSPTMAPLAYAQAQYQETGNPFSAFAQGWVNASAAREGEDQERAKAEAEAEQLKDYPDLQKWVASESMSLSDALRIKEARDNATKAGERKTQIGQYLTQLAGSDEKYKPLLDAWGSGAMDEDGLSKALLDLDKQPTPTDDQRELAQINAEREKAGQQPLTLQEFLGSKQGQGFSVTTNPDGTVSVTQGSAPMKLTEQQSKDLGYYERGVGALPKLEENAAALTQLYPATAGNTPVIGNYLKSDEYRQAEQAGREFLASILRKDSGAAITPDEMANYGRIFLPQPGDDETTLANKSASRTRALEAIKKGLGTAEVLASAMPAKTPEATPQQTQQQTQQQDYPEGTIIENDKGEQMIMKGGQWVEVHNG